MSASWPSTSHFRCDPATLTENQQREYFLFLRQHKLREFTSRQFSQAMSVGPVLIARLTPGHTRGCTTWLLQVKDRGKSLNVVIIGSPNVNPGYQLVANQDYPEIAADYAKTFRLLKSLPCDIFLGAHGNYYGMEAKYARLQKDPNTNPFVDPEGYQAYVEERAKSFQETERKQMKKK